MTAITDAQAHLSSAHAYHTHDLDHAGVDSTSYNETSDKTPGQRPWRIPVPFGSGASIPVPQVLSKGVMLWRSRSPLFGAGLEAKTGALRPMGILGSEGGSKVTVFAGLSPLSARPSLDVNSLNVELPWLGRLKRLELWRVPEHRQAEMRTSTAPADIDEALRGPIAPLGTARQEHAWMDVTTGSARAVGVFSIGELLGRTAMLELPIERRQVDRIKHRRVLPPEAHRARLAEQNACWLQRLWRSSIFCDLACLNYWVAGTPNPSWLQRLGARLRWGRLRHNDAAIGQAGRLQQGEMFELNREHLNFWRLNVIMRVLPDSIVALLALLKPVFPFAMAQPAARLVAGGKRVSTLKASHNGKETQLMCAAEARRERSASIDVTFPGGLAQQNVLRSCQQTLTAKIHCPNDAAAGSPEGPGQRFAEAGANTFVREALHDAWEDDLLPKQEDLACRLDGQSAIAYHLQLARRLDQHDAAVLQAHRAKHLQRLRDEKQHDEQMQVYRQELLRYQQHNHVAAGYRRQGKRPPGPTLVKDGTTQQARPAPQRPTPPAALPEWTLPDQARRSGVVKSVEAKRTFELSDSDLQQSWLTFRTEERTFGDRRVMRDIECFTTAESATGTPSVTSQTRAYACERTHQPLGSRAGRLFEERYEVKGEWASGAQDATLKQLSVAIKLDFNECGPRDEVLDKLRGIGAAPDQDLETFFSQHGQDQDRTLHGTLTCSRADVEALFEHLAGPAVEPDLQPLADKLRELRALPGCDTSRNRVAALGYFLRGHRAPHLVVAALRMALPQVRLEPQFESRSESYERPLRQANMLCGDLLVSRSQTDARLDAARLSARLERIDEAVEALDVATIGILADPLLAVSRREAYLRHYSEAKNLLLQASRLQNLTPSRAAVLLESLGALPPSMGQAALAMALGAPGNLAQQIEQLQARPIDDFAQARQFMRQHAGIARILESMCRFGPLCRLFCASGRVEAAQGKPSGAPAIGLASEGPIPLQHALEDLEGLQAQLNAAWRQQVSSPAQQRLMEAAAGLNVLSAPTKQTFVAVGQLLRGRTAQHA